MKKLLYVLAAIALIACVGGYIWLWVTYGNTPINELPAWVAILLFKE